MIFYLLFIVFLYYKHKYDVTIKRDLFRSLIFLILAKTTATKT